MMEKVLLKYSTENSFKEVLAKQAGESDGMKGFRSGVNIL